MKLPLTTVAMMSLCIASASAQQLFVYPSAGQAPAQQARDQGECQAWATQQSGYNPAGAPPPPPATATQGGLVRGAARGAVVGGVVGSFSGNAGKGAAAGAAGGALIGGLRRADQQRAIDQQQAQAHAQYQQQQAAQAQAQNRAVAACLSGRGYTVQ